jgi:K+/H+ antiporter YhaU regulatory subunit KhtT
MKAISTIAALFLFSGVFLGIASRYLPHGMPIILFGGISIILATCLWKQLSKLNNRIELAFIESFNDKIESQEQLDRKSILAKVVEKNPWPIGIHEVTIKANHEIVGKQLSDVKLRELTGVTVIAMTRGGLSTYKLSPDMQFFPGDHVIIIGTQAQISAARAILLKETEGLPPKRENTQFDILNFCVGNDKNFVGCVLGALDLRQKYGVNVIGIQRKDEKIIDIKSDMDLRADDVILLVGTKSSIRTFKATFSIA